MLKSTNLDLKTLAYPISSKLALMILGLCVCAYTSFDDFNVWRNLLESAICFSGLGIIILIIEKKRFGFNLKVNNLYCLFYLLISFCIFMTSCMVVKGDSYPFIYLLFFVMMADLSDMFFSEISLPTAFSALCCAIMISIDSHQIFILGYTKFIVIISFIYLLLLTRRIPLGDLLFIIASFLASYTLGFTEVFTISLGVIVVLNSIYHSILNRSFRCDFILIPAVYQSLFTSLFIFKIILRG